MEKFRWTASPEKEPGSSSRSPSSPPSVANTVGDLRRGSLALFFTATLALAVLLPKLGDERLPSHPHEYDLTIQTVLEMRQTGRVLVPELWGKPRLQKPPLLTWLMYFFSKLFGISLFWMRFPSVLFAAGTVTLTILVASRLGLSESQSQTAGLLTLSSYGISCFGRVAMLEMPLTFFMTLTFYGLWAGFFEKKNHGFLIGGLALAGATMTKTPLMIGFSLLALILYKTLQFPLPNKGEDTGEGSTKKTERFFAPLRMTALRNILAVLAPSILIAGTWYLYAFKHFPISFQKDIPRELFIDRFLAPPFHHSFSEFILGALGYCLPWSPFVLFSIYQAARTRSFIDHFLLAWIAAFTFPFVLPIDRAPRFFMPALPACCVLTAHHLNLPRKICLLAALLQLVVFGFLYPAIGTNVIPKDIPARFSNATIYRFKREPPFLPIKMGRALKEVELDPHWKEATLNGACVSMRQGDMDELEALTRPSAILSQTGRGEPRWKRLAVWRDIRLGLTLADEWRALRRRNLDDLKENIYIIRLN